MNPIRDRSILNQLHNQWRFLPWPVRLRIILIVLKYHIPALNRFVLLHAAITLLTIILLPPVPQVPPILIPLTWGASLSTAMIIKSIARF